MSLQQTTYSFCKIAGESEQMGRIILCGEKRAVCRDSHDSDGLGSPMFTFIVTCHRRGSDSSSSHPPGIDPREGQVNIIVASIKVDMSILRNHKVCIGESMIKLFSGLGFLPWWYSATPTAVVTPNLSFSPSKTMTKMCTFRSSRLPS